MNPGWLSALANHLWQSTLITAFAAMLVLLLRKHAANVRYWIWFAASAKFLVPFSLLVALGGEVRWRSTAPVSVLPSITIVAAEIAHPFDIPAPAHAGYPTPAPTIFSQAQAILFIIWIAGFLAVVCLWVKSWLQIHAGLRSASPLMVPLEVRVMSSPTALEPGVFGLLRPVLLLPRGIEEHLSEEQLRSVLAHEVCHVRRRDNLLSLVHMAVAAIFWFYPVVWWLGRRLLNEREQACDEQVLREGGNPHAYAEGILKVCKFYLESPLQCAAGVSGSNLQRRIEAILSGRTIRKLDFRRSCVLTAAAIAVIVAPIVFGGIIAPVRAQTPAAPSATFEVASIKRSRPDARGGGIPDEPGGRFVAENTTGRELVTFAFFTFHPNHDSQIVGGPGWLTSDRFDVEARSNRTLSWDERAMAVQAMLEDRFQLKAHKEMREMPIYALTLVKDGLKMKPVDAPQPLDPSVPRPPLGSFKPLPGMLYRGIGRLAGSAIQIEVLVKVLSSLLDRPVLDKTDLKGYYDVSLQYAADANSGDVPRPGVSASDPQAPSLFTAIQEQLGLRLESTKGAVDVIVIDGARPPSEN